MAQATEADIPKASQLICPFIPQMYQNPVSGYGISVSGIWKVDL